MEAWEYCNSLRYGFDDNYDPPLFDDEDNHPREEKQNAGYWICKLDSCSDCGSTGLNNDQTQK